ncbi:MAG: trypsin-like peptidase domain-containing protein [Verrucomicrobiota bacterium]
MSKIILSFFLTAILVQSAWAAEPEKSVIQISTFSQTPNWDSPWRMDSVRRSSGSGFVVRGKRIMTNAHVVSWARQILVRRYQDPKPFLAKVVFIGHDCDLALLEVEDENFFNGLYPLDFGELPEVRSTVVTYGYPAGGEQISYTRGVVSRLELQNFVHIGNRSLLAAQTDAAINPGNSGGPVIQDDKVVGVAFQGIPGLENTGFFIPPPIMNHFMKDIADGKYDGFPQAGVGLAPMHNQAYRRFLKLPDDNLGVRIDRIFPIATTQKVLQEEDVLLQVGPYEVGSDGTILYKGNRVHVAVAFSEAQHGDSVPLKVFRDGKPMELSLPVYVYREDKAEGNQYDSYPRYYIYGGMVFTPLSRDYLRTLGGNWADESSAELVHQLYYQRYENPDKARPEPIVLSTILSHPVNADVKIRGRALVDKINGVKIEKLEDVIKAFETCKEEHDIIEFLPSDQNFECLDRAAVAKAQTDILKTYGVSKDRRL